MYVILQGEVMITDEYIKRHEKKLEKARLNKTSFMSNSTPQMLLFCQVLNFRLHFKFG